MGQNQINAKNVLFWVSLYESYLGPLWHIFRGRKRSVAVWFTSHEMLNGLDSLSMSLSITGLVDDMNDESDGCLEPNSLRTQPPPNRIEMSLIVQLHIMNLIIHNQIPWVTNKKLIYVTKVIQHERDKSLYTRNVKLFAKGPPGIENMTDRRIFVRWSRKTPHDRWSKCFPDEL